MRYLLSAILICVAALTVVVNSTMAQGKGANFRSGQFASDRVANAWNKYNDTLQREFSAKGLKWPATDIFLQAFKSQNVLELWARDEAGKAYSKVKTYSICATSGSLGPKRKHGDRQIPEGYYFIDEFNPQSQYHLSLHLSYPNYSDKLKSGGNPGGDIYIHGSCVTIGCLPMSDETIQEIYTLCLNVKLGGREYIPVHIYPTKMNKKGMEYLMKQTGISSDKVQLWASLQTGYEYFERYHKVMPAMYAPNGNYITWQE